MRGIGLALALGLGLCRSKVVCSSAKANGLPVQVAQPSESPERNLLAKSRGTELAKPGRQSLLEKGRTSIDASASTTDSAVAKARNLLSGASNDDRPKGNILLQGSRRRPKGTVLLNGRVPARRLGASQLGTSAFFRDAPTWRDAPEEEVKPQPEQVKEEEIHNHKEVPFTPCVDDSGELKALYAKDWQPSNANECREHCDSFAKQGSCIGYSWKMTYGCKLFSPAMAVVGKRNKAKAIAGIVKCAASA
jgi:hypothetical protein